VVIKGIYYLLKFDVVGPLVVGYVCGRFASFIANVENACKNGVISLKFKLTDIYYNLNFISNLIHIYKRDIKLI
jgi:hypothetical protein